MFNVRIERIGRSRCGGQDARGDGFHKLPDVPLTFPLGLVIWDLSPSPPLKGRISGAV